MAAVSGMKAIDPVLLAVLKGRLEQIADEMDATLFRSAFNPIIAEAHDASHGLYHADTGETLIQGKSGLPVFVGAMSFAVKAVIDKAIPGFGELFRWQSYGKIGTSTIQSRAVAGVANGTYLFALPGSPS